MFEITPISVTQIDWTKFVTGANKITGRSPTRQIDQAGLPVQTPASFLAALAEFRKEGTNPVTCLQDHDFVLNHYSIGFLIAIDRSMLIHILACSQGLHCIIGDPSRQKENFVVTGTVLSWRNAIIDGCARSATVEAREFYNQIWNFFARIGLQEMFAAYRKKDQDDKTFILEGHRSWK